MKNLINTKILECLYTIKPVSEILMHRSNHLSGHLCYLFSLSQNAPVMEFCTDATESGKSIGMEITMKGCYLCSTLRVKTAAYPGHQHRIGITVSEWEEQRCTTPGHLMFLILPWVWKRGLIPDIISPLQGKWLSQLCSWHYIIPAHSLYHAWQIILYYGTFQGFWINVWSFQ